MKHHALYYSNPPELRFGAKHLKLRYEPFSRKKRILDLLNAVAVYSHENPS